LEVAGRPFLDHLIEKARGLGFDEVVLLAGFRGDLVAAHYAGGRTEWGLDIRCVVEPSAAGTGGALFHAAKFLDDVFLLANGDTLFDFDWRQLDLMDCSTEWLARVALRRVTHAGRYGTVQTSDGRITGFEEKGRTGPGLVNGGVYVVRKSILEQVNTQPCSIETQIFPALAASGLLWGKVFRGYFVDIGLPRTLAMARRHLRRSDASGGPVGDHDDH